MKYFMLVIAILWTIVALIWGSVGSWKVRRDTDNVLDRAQVAADAKGHARRYGEASS